MLSLRFQNTGLAGKAAKCLACLFAAAVTACSAPSDTRLPQTLDAIVESGELVVLTTQGPTTWFETTGGPSGYEFELAEAMAEDLGVETRYVVHDDLSGVLRAIERGEGHVAAAGITQTADREAWLSFGPAYQIVRQEVVCRMGGPQPRDLTGLASIDIAVVAGSSYVESLEAVAASHPDVTWEAVEAASALPILEDVQAGRLDCTVADSNLVAFARFRSPELVTLFELTGEQPLAWALPPQQSEGGTPFREWMGAWFEDAHASGFLADLDERWYGHFGEFDYVEAATFIDRIDDRLDDFQPVFAEAAEAVDVDWLLLAAQAYQESHWDPDAVSPTGVRGLMMLTGPTARELGVQDRTDPEQSIRGGANYLAEMYRRLPDGVTADDRLYMALAAYNIGLGHIHDARLLAGRLGRDPNSWAELREVLPLLSQRQYYETLRHGYARGHEPVRYVRNIRVYRALLEANYSI